MWGSSAVHDPDVEKLLGGAPRVAFEDIVRHPRFPEARKLYLDGFLAVYEGDPFLVRLLIEMGRIALYVLIVSLDAAQDPARRETWLTIGLLKQVIAQFGLASSRHVDHLVACLCAVGFLEQRPSERDRRVRILAPTEKLRAHDRDWLVAQYSPLTVLYPQHDYSLVMQGDLDFQALHRRTTTLFIPLGGKLTLSVPDVTLFLERAGGYLVIATVLQSAMAQADQHAGVPYADIGDRFGISRTHVRKLLTAAEERGLVKLHARGGHRVEILPRLWASHDEGISGGMYFHDMVYVVAMRQWSPAMQRPQTVFRTGSVSA